VIEAKCSSETSLLLCQTTPCHPRRQYPAWSLPLENQISHKFKHFDDGFTMLEVVLLDAVQDFYATGLQTVELDSVCLVANRI
jgi:hypothetical protein